jgi:hypothetical protein
MEVELPHELLETEVILAPGGLHLEPRRLPFREGLGAMPTHDLVEDLSHDSPARRRVAEPHWGEDTGWGRITGGGITF